MSTITRNEVAFGVTWSVTWEFVPGDPKKEEMIHWRATFSDGGVMLQNVDYKLGIGHLPVPWKGYGRGSRSMDEQSYIDTAISKGVARKHGCLLRPLQPPALADLIQCLASDYQSADCSGSLRNYWDDLCWGEAGEHPFDQVEACRKAYETSLERGRLLLMAYTEDELSLIASEEWVDGIAGRSVEDAIELANETIARAEDEVARLRQKRDEILKEGLK